MKWSPDNAARAAELRGQGLKLRQIAKMLSVNESTIRKWLNSPTEERAVRIAPDDKTPYADFQRAWEQLARGVRFPNAGIPAEYGKAPLPEPSVLRVYE